MNNVPFEVIRIENKKAPLFLEVPVPPHCTPILVGHSKSNQLKWTDKPNSQGRVMTWGLKLPIEQVSQLCIDAIKNKGQTEGWEIEYSDENEAKINMKEVGIENVKRMNNLLIPSDHDILGTLVIFEDMVYPVIHNAIRAISFIG
jgi:hypothetical protein